MLHLFWGLGTPAWIPEAWLHDLNVPRSPKPTRSGNFPIEKPRVEGLRVLGVRVRGLGLRTPDIRGGFVNMGKGACGEQPSKPTITCILVACPNNEQSPTP